MESVQVTIEVKGDNVPYSKLTTMVGTTSHDALMGALMATIALHRLDQEPTPNGS